MNLNIPISAVMTKEVAYVQPEQKLIDVKHIFEKKNFHHHIPVVENGKLSGMISLTDFLFAIKNASLNDNDKEYYRLIVKDIMRIHPITIESTATLKSAVEELAKGDVHAIAVCDDGVLKGIISTADVMRFVLL